MASEQLVKSIQYVAPKDLDYVGGKWRLPSDLCPTAELISAISFTASGKVDIERTTKYLVVQFEVSKTINCSGFDGADVNINIKVGKDKVVAFSVQKQLDAMKPDEKAPLRAVFMWNGDIGFEKLHFSLSDTTSKQMKGGLIIYRAIVEALKDIPE